MMKKFCSGCSEERDAEQDFNWKYPDRGIRHTRCKFCMSRVSKQHYQDNKRAYMARIHARDVIVVEDNRQKLAAYLINHPCVDCGQADIRVLEFDHMYGNKVENIARMVGEAYSWSTIEAEIAKCEVRCANCHRFRTVGERSTWRHFVEVIVERTLDRIQSHNAHVKAINRQKLYAYLS